MFLTETQLGVQALAREFVQKDLNPVLSVLETGDLNTLKAMWQRMADIGLTGLPFPEEYGGSAVDSLSYFLVLEEIAKASSALATSLSVHVSLGGLPILYYGTDDQKARYLPDVVQAKKIGAFALTEPNAGSDAGSGLTKAEKNGSGYVLNGSKLFITNAFIASFFVSTARTNREISGAKGLTAFLVDTETPGLVIHEGDEKMGLKGSDWGELTFEDCKVPEAQRLSEEGVGFKIFMKSLDIGRISIGAISLGVAEACLDASLEYAKQRYQFGKTLSEFQAIQMKLADMAMQIEAARSLVYSAARLKEAGLPFSKEASMAKCYASEMCNACAREAVQIFGGYGYTKDFPVERYFRDARVMSLFEGTSQIQRTVIAKHLLKG
ncbi:MAG: acyl-CoA dehydrogenase family protein [Cyanobacteria bacterium]|nr:acyl-CoA dehydrogenase family protein [Cyanobacteriota bacterium]